MLLMLRETVKKKCGKFHTRVSNGLKWLQGVENDLVQISPPSTSNVEFSTLSFEGFP